MQKTKGYIARLICVISWIYIVVVAGIMPFYFTNGYGYIGSDKANFVKKFGYPILIAGAVGLVIYVVLNVIVCCKGKTREEVWLWVKKRFSVTDIFVLCYAGVLILSYLSTEYKDIAWYGHTSWPMGLVPHLMMVTSYFLLSRFFIGREYFFGLLRKISLVVFALGILNTFGVRPIEMEYASYWFISTLGNLNWFCGYWTLTGLIAVICYWNHEVRGDKKNLLDVIFDGGVATIAMFTGLIHGSDSGVFALAVVFLVMFCMSVENGDRMQRFFELLIMLCGICSLATIVNHFFPEAITFPGVFVNLTTRTVFPWAAGIFCGILYYFVQKKNAINLFPKKIWKKLRVVVIGTVLFGLMLYFVVALANTLLPEGLGPFAGKSAFIFDVKWGSQRGGPWSAAVRTWWGQDFWHKLVGVGPDSMWSYISSGKDVALQTAVTKQFPQNLLNAHEEWLTNLANLGLFGAVSFAGYIVSFIYRCFKKGKKDATYYIFAFAVLCYTVNNIFSFQTVINLTHLFMIMGVGENMIRRQEGKRYLSLTAFD